MYVCVYMYILHAYQNVCTFLAILVREKQKFQQNYIHRYIENKVQRCV